jgi:hypothetical protein
MTRKRKIALAIGVVALGVAATLTYAVLPTTNVDPTTVPIGTLSGATVNVLSVDAFTRAINQAHGTNGVLQHLRFVAQQSTGWHEHRDQTSSWSSVVRLRSPIRTATSRPMGRARRSPPAWTCMRPSPARTGPISMRSTSYLRMPQSCARTNLRRAVPCGNVEGQPVEAAFGGLEMS